MPTEPSPPGRAYSVNTPAVLTRPTWPAPGSVNHSAPSGPAVISHGDAPAVGMACSVNLPPVVTRPTLLVSCSTNHMAPSGPGVTERGLAPRVGTLNRVALPPEGLIRPITPWLRVSPGGGAFSPVNQTLPSGPAAVPARLLMVSVMA